MAGAMWIKTPSKRWKPAGWDPSKVDPKKNSMVTTGDVHYAQATKTPQFSLIWFSVFGKYVFFFHVFFGALTSKFLKKKKCSRRSYFIELCKDHNDGNIWQ